MIHGGGRDGGRSAGIAGYNRAMPHGVYRAPLLPERVKVPATGGEGS